MFRDKSVLNFVILKKTEIPGCFAIEDIKTTNLEKSICEEIGCQNRDVTLYFPKKHDFYLLENHNYFFIARPFIRGKDLLLGIEFDRETLEVVKLRSSRSSLLLDVIVDSPIYSTLNYLIFVYRGQLNLMSLDFKILSKSNEGCFDDTAICCVKDGTIISRDSESRWEFYVHKIDREEKKLWLYKKIEFRNTENYNRPVLTSSWFKFDILKPGPVSGSSGEHTSKNVIILKIDSEVNVIDAMVVSEFSGLIPYWNDKVGLEIQGKVYVVGFGGKSGFWFGDTAKKLNFWHEFDSPGSNLSSFSTNMKLIN